MADYATHTDVAARWPSLNTAQYDQADTLCGDASLILRTQYPGIDDSIQTDADLAERAKLVVCNMVKRAMLTITPGVSQESSGTGPYSHGVTYANPFGNLFVTSAEDAIIRGYLPRAVTLAYPDDCA